MGKISVLCMSAFLIGGLGCQSEGKIPFGDDALSPGSSGGRGGSSGSFGAGGTVASGGSAGTTGGSGGTSGSGGTGGTSGSDGATTVGRSCYQDSECRALDNGYCADSAEICTAECESHVDCGCPGGTTNSDIADGACAAACITYDDGSAYCLRVCDSGYNCESGSYCEELEYYGVCTPG